MSVESMAICLHHSQAKGAARLVLIGIANHDGDGGAWPSHETLAVYAGGVDNRTVRRAVKQLVELGEVSVQVNGGGDENTRGDRRPNRYRILLRCPPTCDRTSSHRVQKPDGHGRTDSSPRDPDGRTSEVEREDIPVHNGRVPVSTEPSLNHPEPQARCATSTRPAETQRAGGPIVIDKPVAIVALERAFAARERIRNFAPFHRLSLGDAERLVELVTRHGADRLADHAAATALTARSWRAFVPDWQNLPGPTPVAPDLPRCEICNQKKGAHTAPAFNDHEFLLPQHASVC